MMEKNTIKKSIKNDGIFSIVFFSLIDFLNVFLINIMLNFHLILIEFSFDLCGFSMLYRCVCG